MSLRMIVVLAALALILVLVAWSGRRRPRVTEITRTVRRKKEGEGQ